MTQPLVIESAPARCLGCANWADASHDYCYGCKAVFCVVCSDGLKPGGHTFMEHKECADEAEWILTLAGTVPL